jgi:hypothetical protein
MYLPVKHFTKNTKNSRLELGYGISGEPFEDLLLVSLDKFSSGRILAGCLSSFWIFY